MHPSGDFRANPPELASLFVREIGFAALFAATPDGPRVAHTPILLDDAATHIRFHIARGNSLARYVEGQSLLAVVQGPDAYVSAHDYGTPDQVPTWNYVAIEMEGTPKRLPDAALHDFLADLAQQQDGRADISPPWSRDLISPRLYDRLFAAIIGFEMRIKAWRPTLKLSQNKSAAERENVAAALQSRGHGAMAQLMRQLIADKDRI